MWLFRLQDSISNQEIEVASHARWSQPEALTDDDRGRRSIFEHRTCHRIAGAELVDFHNSIVT
jgi:hypothetical protein